MGTPDEDRDVASVGKFAAVRVAFTLPLSVTHTVPCSARGVAEPATSSGTAVNGDGSMDLPFTLCYLAAVGITTNTMTRTVTPGVVTLTKLGVFNVTDSGDAELVSADGITTDTYGVPVAITYLPVTLESLALGSLPVTGTVGPDTALPDDSDIAFFSPPFDPGSSNRGPVYRGPVLEGRGSVLPGEWNPAVEPTVEWTMATKDLGDFIVHSVGEPTAVTARDIAGVYVGVHLLAWGVRLVVWR